MHQLTDKIKYLVAQYEKQLNENGIGCSVLKKYFEIRTPVSSFRSTRPVEGLFRHFADKRENSKFKHQNNRKYCIVLCFYPLNKDLLKETNCKEFAFVLREISRFEEGFAPKERVYKEKSILKRIEKKILYILKKAEKKSVVKLCKNTYIDFLRYFFLPEYGYKKSIFGYNRNIIDTVFCIIFMIVLIIAALMIYLNIS